MQSSIQVKPSYGLSDDEITNMLKASMLNAKEDIQARLLAEQRVEAQRVLESVGSALSADQDLLNDEELSAVKNAIISLQRLQKKVIRKKLSKVLNSLILQHKSLHRVEWISQFVKPLLAKRLMM